MIVDTELEGYISSCQVMTEYRDGSGKKPLDYEVTVTGTNWTITIEHLSMYDLSGVGQKARLRMDDKTGSIVGLVVLDG